MAYELKTNQHDGRFKIAIACFAVNPGLADYLVGLANSLRQHASVEVWTSDTIDLHNRAMLGPAHYCFRRSRHLAIDIWRYIWGMLTTRPDLLLVQAWLKFPLIEIPVIWLFRMAGIRCVVTVHDVLPHEPGRWDSRILRLYYRAFDALVAHSEAARNQLTAMGVNRPIAVIPHALLDHFYQEPLDQATARVRVPGLDPDIDDFVALFFGHVTQRKGAFAFAQAAMHLPPDAGIKLLMAGQPELPAADLQRLRSICKQGNVIFCEGHVAFKDVQTYFTSADCVVIPYLEGTTSGVMKIAIAFEKPVIATPIGDVAETVDCCSAVIISVDNLPAAIAAGIIEARSRAAELTVGVQALKADLSWNKIGQSYASFLSRVIEGLHQPVRSAETITRTVSQVSFTPK